MKRILIATATLLLSVSCTKKSQEGDLGLNLNETVRINIRTEPPSIDWHKGTDTTSSTITNNLMDGLTAYNLDDPELSVRPALALSWEPSANATVWTFKIRPGVKWTDGQELTAQHFVDAWERLLNPATAAEYAYYLNPIKGAQEYNQGKTKDFSTVGVKAIDPLTLQVTLKSPMGFFPSLVTHHCTFPIRKDVVDKFKDKWTDPDKIVTLGPYKLTRWDHDQQLVLERYDGYYGEKAKTKYVLTRMIKDQATGINLFESGKLDALTELPSTDLPKMKGRPEFKQAPFLASYYYGFNVKKAPFDNVNVRKAFASAIDRREITKMLAGDQIPMTGWIPSGMFGYEADAGTKFDVAKAREYLKKAGYTDPKKLPKVTLAFNTLEDHQRIAENVQAQLKRNLGVEIELKNEEWKVYLKTLQTDTPQIFRMGWVADYPDPDNFMTLMLTHSDNNHTHWGNAEFDRIVTQAGGEIDKDKRKKLYSDAQKILVEQDVPVIPIYTNVTHYFISKRIKNFPINPLQEMEYSKIEVVNEGAK